MRNFKIGNKLLITFSIIVLFFCVMVGISISSLIITAQNFSNFYASPYQNAKYALQLKGDIEAVGNYIGSATMTEDETLTAQYIQLAQASLDNMKESIAYLENNFQDDSTLVPAFKEVMSASTHDREQIFQLLQIGQRITSSKLYLNNLLPQYETAKGILDQLVVLTAENADRYYNSSVTVKNQAFIFLLVCSVAMVIVTILLASYVTKSLTHPISEIQKATKQMSAGNLNVQISYKSKDEMGHLADNVLGMSNQLSRVISDLQSLLGEMANGNFVAESQHKEAYVGQFQPLLESTDLMKRRISQTLLQIERSANQVSSGSDQVSSGAQALAQGATEQASSVEQLAATITQVSNQVNETASHAEDAYDQIEKTKELVSICNKQMGDMTNAMDDINKSSLEIGKIIKTIEDIAFQTNILALNAAVEAARAGAAGKGFAVVADEVRNLASKSAEASQNTSALIASSLQAVKKGTQIAQETAHSLADVVLSTDEVTTSMNEISSAAKDQSSSISQITSGIDQISSVVQTNSATAEQSAAASEELSGQAQMLKQLVSQFQLQNEFANAQELETPSLEYEVTDDESYGDKY